MLPTMRRRLSEVDGRPLDAVGRHTDDQVRAPSQLPGWSLELVATDSDEHLVLGDGPDVVTLRGSATALIAWLAERAFEGVTAQRGDRPVDLPTLEPWP